MNTRPEKETALLLYPTEDPAFTSKLDPFRRMIERVITLNYAEHCHEHGIRDTEKKIRDIITAEKVSAVILFPFASDFQLSVPFYAGLRELTKVVLWLADDPTYFDAHARYYAQAADLVMTSDPLAVHAYRRLGVRAVYNLDIVLANKLDPVAAEKDMDVLFIGDTGKPGRKESIDFLRRNGIAVKVFGPGSPEGWVPFGRIAEFFCRSKIVLNFSRVAAPCWINDDEPLLNRVRQNTGRPIETALTRTFCLTEYSPGLEFLFRPGEEIVVFHNKEELLEKVRYYLANPSERERVAAKAYARALAEYEPESALRKAIAKAFSALREPLPPVDYGGVYLSRNFRRKTVNSLTFSFFIMIRRGKFRYALETIPLLFRYGPLDFAIGAAGGIGRAFSLLASRLFGKRPEKI